MSKPKNRARVFNREFKVGIVGRMLAGENVSALARELRFSRKDLYVWRDRFLSGGPRLCAAGVDRARRRRRARLGARGPRPAQRAGRLRRRASGLPSWSARSASSSWNWIFFGKPCGRSGEHAGRAPSLA